MQLVEEQSECELCGKRGEDLSRFSANHKELGLIMVCQNCWVKLYEDNHMVSNSTGSSNTSTNPCATCSNSTCRF
jgi:hypothetical protein